MTPIYTGTQAGSRSGAVTYDAPAPARAHTALLLARGPCRGGASGFSGFNGSNGSDACSAAAAAAPEGAGGMEDGGYAGVAGDGTRHMHSCMSHRWMYEYTHAYMHAYTCRNKLGTRRG